MGCISDSVVGNCISGACVSWGSSTRSSQSGLRADWPEPLAWHSWFLALQMIGCPGIVPFPLGQGELRLHKGCHLGSKLKSRRKGRAVKSQVKDPREGVVGLANSSGQLLESRNG